MVCADITYIPVRGGFFYLVTGDGGLALPHQARVPTAQHQHGTDDERNTSGGNPIGTVDEGVVRNQDIKSRGHQTEWGTILAWPSNCLSEPNHSL